MSEKIIVRVEGTNDAETAAAIEFLNKTLTKVSDVEGVPHKVGQSGLEFLTVILSSVVLKELAKGLANLFQRDRAATVEVKFEDGRCIKISGISQKSAKEIYAELSDGGEIGG